jgi:hypothetical protein
MLFVIVKDPRNCSTIKRSTIRPYNAYSLTIEMKDSLASSFDEAIDLATYSNSESTVCSYLSIFETLGYKVNRMKRKNRIIPPAIAFLKETKLKEYG